MPRKDIHLSFAQMEKDSELSYWSKQIFCSLAILFLLDGDKILRETCFFLSNKKVYVCKNAYLENM